MLALSHLELMSMAFEYKFDLMNSRQALQQYRAIEYHLSPERG